MPRPKKNTPEGKKATERWRATMLAKYGEDGFRDHVKRNGSKGGRVKGLKGFALRPELARIAGRKGGIISRRTGIRSGQGKKNNPFYYDGTPKDDFTKELEILESETNEETNKDWHDGQGGE